MTNVQIQGAGDGYQINISGHAGYGAAMGLKPGMDIVCAAISTLSQTAVQVMIDLAERGKVQIGYLDIRDGYVGIWVDKCGGADNEIDTAVMVIKTGFELLANAYPQYVRLGWEI